MSRGESSGNRALFQLGHYVPGPTQVSPRTGPEVPRKYMRGMVGAFINGGTPIAGLFIMENNGKSLQKWVTWGYHHFRNLYMVMETCMDVY